MFSTVTRRAGGLLRPTILATVVSNVTPLQPSCGGVLFFGRSVSAITSTSSFPCSDSCSQLGSGSVHTVDGGLFSLSCARFYSSSWTRIEAPDEEATLDVETLASIFDEDEEELLNQAETRVLNNVPKRHSGSAEDSSGHWPLSSRDRRARRREERRSARRERELKQQQRLNGLAGEKALRGSIPVESGAAKSVRTADSSKQAGTRLIVGLCNPGKRYRFTRHNLGGDAVLHFGEKHQVSFHEDPTMQAEIGSLDLQSFFGNQKPMVACSRVLLVTPLTYMNLSGDAVRALVKKYRVRTEDTLIVYDDFNLSLGRCKFKLNGNAGGHRGVADVIQKLKHNQFPRLRCGLSEAPIGQNVMEYVLEKWTPAESRRLELGLSESALALDRWLRLDITRAMCDTNVKPNDESLRSSLSILQTSPSRRG